MKEFVSPDNIIDLQPVGSQHESGKQKGCWIAEAASLLQEAANTQKKQILAQKLVVKKQVSNKLQKV